MNHMYHKLRISLSAVLLLACSPAFADYTIGDLTYAPDANLPYQYANVTGRATTATEITIPEKVVINGKNLTVHCINDGAFADSDIVSIAIPPTITKVAGQPFKGCNALTRVEITDIGSWYAIDFSQDGNPLVQAHNLYLYGSLIEKVYIRNVKKYENENGITYSTSNPYTFQGATCIKEVTFAEGITEFDGRTLKGCTGITSIVFPKTLKYISNYGCSGMVNLQEISIPESVDFIGGHAFEGCTSLKRVVLPKHCRFASGYTFQGCTALEEVVLPETTTNVYPSWPDRVFGSGTYKIFDGCTSLKKVTMPKESIMLDSYTFRNTAITELPDMTNVSSIGKYVFEGCQNLTKVEWPSKFSTIPDYTFNKCSNLSEIVIPSTVTEIKNCAFIRCTNLSEITIPSTVTELGSGAFSSSGISEIDIPSGVTVLHNIMFYGCKNLRSLTLHKDITELEGWQHFTDSGLEDLIVLAVTPPAAYGRTFERCNATVYVLPGSVEAYSAAEYWNTLEIRPLAIDLGAGALRLGLDDTYPLSAEYVPASFKGGDITWTSENPEIAAVDANGVVTPVAAGNTRIKAVSAANNEIVGEKDVEVSTSVSVAGIDEASDACVDVFDIQGRLLLRGLNAAEAARALQPGIYLIHSGSAITKTLIK